MCMWSVDYTNTVDFDPGPATNNHTSNGNRDAFMSKFGSDGTWLWTKTWGSSNDDRANSVAVYGTQCIRGRVFPGRRGFQPIRGRHAFSAQGHNGMPNNDAFLCMYDVKRKLQVGAKLGRERGGRSISR